MTHPDQIKALLEVDANGLLPCAHCGSYAQIYGLEEKDRCVTSRQKHIYCSKCRNRTASFFSLDMAIEKWNSRPAMRQMVKDIQELRKELQHEEFAEGVTRSRFQRILTATAHYEGIEI
jgi:hypothetical protein